MQEFRNFLDIMTIEYRDGQLSYTVYGSEGIMFVYERYFEMFKEAFDYAGDISINLCVNDAGCWYNNVVNIADFRDKCEYCFPYHDYFYEDDFDEKCQRLQKCGDEPYVHDKLFWIGSLFENGPDARKEFCKLKHDRIVNIDATSSNVFVSHEDHPKYRYLLDIEGGFQEKAGYSRRIAFLLHMKRLLFFVDRPLYSFVCYKLEPWVHYVPVKRDLSDLVEKIEWADSHPDEVKTIIENMTRAAPTRQDAINQIKKIVAWYRHRSG